MTNEELLKPRYKVIAQYPRCPFKTGHILTLSEKAEDGKYWHKFSQSEPIHIDEGWNDYPHLFKPLHWWEEREDSEMPKYIKARLGFVRKVIEWTKDRQFAKCENPRGTHLVRLENLTPATESDYTNQNTQK